jgi:hypothetical protein
MTTRNALIALAGATVVVGAVACGGTNTTGATSQSPTATTTSTTTEAPAATTTTTTPAAAPSACDDLGGHVGNDQNCTVHTDGPGYTIDMRFPSTYPDQPALTAILVRQRDQFVQAVTEPPVRDVAKALDIKPTTHSAPTLRTESLVLEEYVNVGGAHPETYYDALNFDLGTWKPITFDTLFKPGTDPVAVLDPIVENELKNRLQGAPVDANPIGAEMYKNFALTDDAVIFFIGQGMWTIEAAGAQQVSVPRSELASILA